MLVICWRMRFAEVDGGWVLGFFLFGFRFWVMLRGVCLREGGTEEPK